MSTTVSVLSSMALRQSLLTISRLFEASHDARVDLTAIGGVQAAERLRRGERFDVVVLAEDAIKALEREMVVEPGTCTTLALSATALAVRSLGARPTALDAASLSAFVQSVRVIGVSTGPSGQNVRRWLASGADKPMSFEIVEAPPGMPVAKLLAAGRVDLGFQQLSELLDQPDIDVVGVLPPDVLPVTAFAGAIGRGTPEIKAAARALLAFYASAAAKAVLERHGLAQPAQVG